MKRITSFVALMALIIALLTTSVLAVTELEPNNSFDNAMQIKLGQQVDGELESYSDSDYYQFTVEQAGCLRITLQHDYMDSPANCLLAAIYSRDGDLLQSNEFVGNDRTKVTTLDMGLDQGIYYLKIAHSTAYFVGAYQFLIDFEVSEDWEVEPNDSRNEATQIAVNKKVNGALWQYADADFYTFTLDAAGSVYASLQHDYLDVSATCMKLTIYDKNYTELQSVNFAGDEIDSVETTKIGLDQGTYYVKISQGAHAYVGKYNFKMTYAKNSTWEKEKNDNVASATKLMLNQTHFGSLTDYSDVDYYCFTLSEAGSVYTKLSHEYANSSASCMRAVLYNSSNVELQSSDFFSNETDAVETVKFGLGAGTYYLKIMRGNNYFDGVYSFSVNFEASDAWEIEPNDTVGTATAVEVNQKTSASLTSYSDVDFFKFTLDAAGSVCTTITHEATNSTSSCIRVALLDKNNTELQSMDVYGNEASADTVKFGLDRGTYYLKITHANSFSSGEYQFTVGYQASDAWEKEVNNSTAEAGTIAPNKTNFASLSNYSDVDFFKFTLDQAGSISVSLTHELTSSTYSCIRATLLDKNSNELQIMDFVGNETSGESIRFGLDRGTYYLKIMRGGSSYIGEYSFKLNYEASDVWEIEKNDSTATATVMALNTTEFASLNTPSDVDYFKFTLDAAGYISTTLAHDVASSSVSCIKAVLLDDANNEMQSTEYLASEAKSDSLCYGLDRGTYYLKIMRGSSEYLGEYSVVVNFEESDEWEIENNESTVKATNIAPNKTYHATISDYRDVDYFCFKLEEAGFISTSLAHDYSTSTSNCLTFTLYDEKGTVLQSTECYGNDTAAVKSIQYGLDCGTYYLRVTHGSSFYTGEYSICVDFEPSDAWEKESNDNALSATDLTVNKLYNASLATESDVDYYRFTLTENGPIYVSVEHDFVDSDSSCIEAIVYGEDGTQLMSAEYAGSLRGLNDSLRFGLARGTYYLKIKQGYRRYVGEYSLRVGFTASDEWELERNDNAAAATELLLNKTMRGSLSSLSDVDYFYFLLHQSGNVVLHLNHDYVESSTSCIAVTIFDHDNKELLTCTYNGNDIQEAISLPLGLDEGDYTIRIKYDISRFSGEYDFRLDFTPSVDWEMELNNTAVTANVVDVNQKIFAALTSNSDVDYYTFHADQEGTFSISMDHEFVDSNSDYISAVLYDSANKQMKAFSFVGNAPQTETSAKVYLTEGDYYVAVSHANRYYVGEYSFTLNFSNRGIKFDDVPDDAYYKQAVSWAAELGIVAGLSETKFGPNAECTRAQVVTFLWRAAGEPTPLTTECKFKDVKKGTYYYNAVLWANENNVTAGMSEDTFGTNLTCTRAQFVSLLYRYEGEPYVGAVENPFRDVKDDAYYYKAVMWAVKNEITAGMSDSLFGSQYVCTRAHVVSFLHRDLSNK